MGRIRAFFTCRRVRTILLRAETGEASPEELDRARAHLNKCLECREAESFQGGVARAWQERENVETDPGRKERTLRVALRSSAGEHTIGKPRRQRFVLRWGPVTAGLAVCLVAVVFLRGGSGPQQVGEPVPVTGLEWTNGVEEALARISGETAALWNGMLPPEPSLDPVGEGIARVEDAVAELRLSREEAWSYGFEKRLHGLAQETADMSAILGSP